MYWILYWQVYCWLAACCFCFCFLFPFRHPSIVWGGDRGVINHFPAFFVYCLSCFLHAKRRFAFGKYVLTNVDISFAHEVRAKVCWMVCKAGALLLGKVILRGKYQLIYLVRALRLILNAKWCAQIRCGCIFPPCCWGYHQSSFLIFLLRGVACVYSKGCDGQSGDM